MVKKIAIIISLITVTLLASYAITMRLNEYDKKMVNLEKREIEKRQSIELENVIDNK